jgi:hypothetical protein
LREINLSLDNLASTDTSFHGIIPRSPNIPLGRLALDIVFGSQQNCKREKLEF